MEKRTKNGRVGRPKDPLFTQRREGLKVQIDFSDPQWWTKNGVDYIERTTPPRVLRSAKSYVRNGKVLDADIRPGLVEAKVQGRRKSPYYVRLYFPLPGEDELREIKRRLSERALYGALLLAGEMPVAMEDIFLASGSPFLPFGTGRERFFCSCSEPDDFCKHIAAVLYAATGLFDNDPFLLLKLRGIGNEDLLESILVARDCNALPEKNAGAGCDFAVKGGDAAVSSAESDPEEPIPLDASFYGGKAALKALLDYRDHSARQKGLPSSLVPLFDYLLWRGEASFSDSIDPYYESARKLFSGK